MPDADKQINLLTVGCYCIAAIATHIIADVVSYYATGFSMRKIDSWRGIFNFFITIALMGAAFTYIDSFTPGSIIVIDSIYDLASQSWVINCSLSCIVVAITTSFARSSVKHQEILRIEDECADINSHIDSRNAEKSVRQGPIIMDQIVNIDTGDNRPTEIAVCDIIYARKTDKQHITIAYSLGAKTCRIETAFNRDIAELLHIFANYRQIMRCHKDYIVNIDRVAHASRNGNHYEFHMHGTKRIIPVSKKYRSEIYKALTSE